MENICAKSIDCFVKVNPFLSEITIQVHAIEMLDLDFFFLMLRSNKLFAKFNDNNKSIVCKDYLKLSLAMQYMQNDSNYSAHRYKLYFNLQMEEYIFGCVQYIFIMAPRNEQRIF